MIDKVMEIELLPADRVMTRPVHQWDIGQIIKITDMEIADGTPVDFGNRFMNEGLRAYMIDNQVTIPAPALQQDRDLTGYVVVTDENSETTVKEIFIPVIPRPKPEDYVDEEIRESTEFQYVIMTAAEVEANAKKAEEAAKNAIDSERNAADSELSAYSYATGAANSASIAQGAANNAANSASIAQGAANNAANSASAAKKAKDDAETAQKAAETAKISSTSISNGELFITYANGEIVNVGKVQGTSGNNGKDGKDGESVTITEIIESTEDGGDNVVTFSDESSITIKNGSKGSTGETGDVGATGADGLTPTRGSDYWTDADKAEIVQSVLDAISGTVTGGVGNDNVIALTGVLAAGTYTIKYQNSDGSLTEIGTLTVGSSTTVEPTYENLVPTAKSFADTTIVFNDVGYKDGTYLSSASPFYGSDTEVVCTGLIPATTSSVFYIKGVELNSAKSHCRLGLFKSNSGVAACFGAWVISNASTYMTIETLGTKYYKVTLKQEYLDADAAMKNMQYFAFSAVGSGENLIVATSEIE